MKRNGPVKITVKEPGPLLASLLIESEAPGCTKLIREVRLSAGSDYLELINTVDKKRLEAKNYLEARGKESVNFAFPFNVPEGADAARSALGRHETGDRSDARVLQELAHRGPVGGHCQ